MFFMMERIRENYARRSMHMHVYGAGAHPHCVNKFCNTMVMRKFTTVKKYPLYIIAHKPVTALLTLVHYLFRLVYDDVIRLSKRELDSYIPSPDPVPGRTE